MEQENPDDTIVQTEAEQIQEEIPLTTQLAFLDSSIVDAKAKIKEVSKTRKSAYLIGTVLAFILGLSYGQVAVIPPVVLTAAWILMPLFFISGLGSDSEKHRIELEKLESTKRLYINFFNIRTDEAYFDQLVKINIENLSDYYSLVKIHTGQSFNASIIVAVVGFVLIAAGLAAGFINENFRNITYLATGAGMMVEFISGVMFYLYSKTVRQLKSYHDSLLDVQNILLSFKLIESTEDEKDRSAMTLKMIEFLSARRTPRDI